MGREGILTEYGQLLKEFSVRRCWKMILKGDVKSRGSFLLFVFKKGKVTT